MKKKKINANNIKDILNTVIHEKIRPVAKLNLNLKNKSAAEIEYLVHTLRVTLKRLRALWFLLAPFTTKANYKREKNNLTRACKSLGVSRDDAIKKVTLKNLLKEVDNADDQDILVNIFMIVQKRPIHHSHHSIINAIDAIHRSLIVFKKFDFADQELSLLKCRLIKSLNKAKETFNKTSKNSTSRNFHKLRISSKRFLYQLEFFKVIFTKDLNEIHTNFDKVQERLGLFHDLDVTSSFILSHKKYFACHKNKTCFIKFINKRKKFLIRESILLAKGLFQNKQLKLHKKIDELGIE